jgi:glycosyltransferase involved in cell wall biosynthesis
MSKAKPIKRVCLTPRVSGVGGMVSFHAKLSRGLAQRGIEVTTDVEDEAIDVVLVIGGTRQLVQLRRLSRRGVPIVQRLDGMNWLHRKLRTGMGHWLRAEIANWLLAYIRERIANRIVYQSRFVEEWWTRVYGDMPKSKRVIYNGVDLELFNPGKNSPVRGKNRILLVEGNLQGGYEMGITSAVALAERLQETRETELVIAGKGDEKLKARWNKQAKVKVEWAGVIRNEELPELYRSAHMLFSGDLNAACPNSVIEAMACGLPVLAFDTGALKELVPASAGRVVAYGSNPWKLEQPNIMALAQAAEEILENQTNLQTGARANAEEYFGLDRMVDEYIEALSG